MVEAVFNIIHAGPLVSVQDLGRPNLMRYGVPRSGPMDQKSFAIANAALGNAANSPCIELSTAGLSLECIKGAVTLAVVGGGFIVEAGDQRLGSWTVLTVKAGQKLTIKPGPWGSWSYLAFAGQLDATPWLGSAATHSQSGQGGGKLVSGGQIVVQSAKILPNCEGTIPCPVWARPRHEIHIVAGPQDRFFDEAAFDALLRQPFRLTDAYDRMGVRLRGPSLIPKAALSIPSEAILRGSIQVSGDGTATVLLADHQTTGGYPKIATIIADDVDGFCQNRPHDEVRFKSILPQAAVELTRRRANAMAVYLSGLERRRQEHK